MQDGFKVYMDSYMASNGSCFMFTWTIFKNLPLGGRPNTKSTDHGTPNVHNRRFILLLSLMKTHMKRNSLKYHLVEGPVTCDFTLHLGVHDHTTFFLRCVGTAFGHFLLGSHIVMVTALGLCVKWPYVYPSS